MCFISRDDEEAGLEKHDARNRKEGEKPKKEHGIRRLPTKFIRNKTPRKHPIEKLVDVSMLGLRMRDVTAEAPYLFHFQKHLARAYADACGRRAKLTRAAFVEFLKRIQGDEVVTPPSKDEYTYEEFLEEWTLRYGLGALGDLRPDQKDLSKPISNYFISSSHNTYLEGHQIYSESSAKIYQKVLERHCRCIEIDVWDGDISPNVRPRSRSPDPSHKRNHSSSSLRAYETLKQRLARPNSPLRHSRYASTREPTLLNSESTAESSSTGESSSAFSSTPQLLSDRFDASRARSNPSIIKGEPVVMHAWKDVSGKVWSLTLPVGFRDVCRAIRNSAFSHDNHLPIIVSLEMHACLEQQEVLVKIMKEEWAGYLLEKPLDNCNPNERQPRLEELLDKILIKVKRPQSKAAPPGGKPTTLAAPSVYDEELSASDDERGEKTGEKRRPISDSLAALAIYTHSQHYKALGVPSARTHSHVFSIVEGEIQNIYKKSPTELLEHNRRYFMRAYPHPILRIGSHNPDPSVFWRKGVQMVALNWQDDKYDQMVLHDAMFTDDTRGWVLKPRGYRSTDDEGDDGKPECRTLTLRITVYAGLYVPLPEARLEKSSAPGAVIIGDGDGDKRFKPSVQVDLAVSHEKASGKLVQKTTANATTHPDWGPGGFCLEFVGVANIVEELSFVRFKIKDESPYFRDQVAAWACIRLDRLRQGYRFIDLTDCKGNPSEGKLLVKVDKVVRPPMGLVRSQTMKWWDQMGCGK